MVSFADVTSFFYLKTVCRRMAHFLYYFFQRDLSFMIKFQHRSQCMLNQWSSLRRLPVGVLFLFQGRGGMNGGNDIQSVVQQRF